MSSRCYVPGCRDEPVVRLKYRDSLGALCVEARCPPCARKLRDSTRTAVVEMTPIGDSDGLAEYDRLTEEERELIRDLTTGPYAEYAA